MQQFKGMLRNVEEGDRYDATACRESDAAAIPESALIP
jgi:hypothetical protein